MNATRTIIPVACCIAALAIAGLAMPAAAQNGRPAPVAPSAAAPTVNDAREAARNTAADEAPRRNGRRDMDRHRDREANMTRREAPEGEVMLAFNDVSIEETIPFIVRTTGKVVIPIRLQTLRTQKITLVNDEPIDRAEALDMLFAAFRLNDIGVVELEDRITLGAITDIVGEFDFPIIPPDEDIMHRRDVGSFIVKMFLLEEAEAAGIEEQLREHLPDYASMTVDPNSNTIVLVGDVGLAQRIQMLIDELDNIYIKVKTKTYRLRYADASEIADNIVELFETDQSSSRAGATSNRGNTRGRTPQRNRGRQQPNAPRAGERPGPVAELRLTVNTQQNTVTIQADPSVIDDTDTLIYEFWDLPRPDGTSKRYVLRYTDPIKMRDTLEELLEQGGGGGGARRTGGGGGGGQRTSVEQAVSGIYRIEAYPDSNSLLVLCKTEESFTFLDSIINDLDQPSLVGLPIIIELKHADAVSLADELNVLLSIAGANVTLDRPDTGLSGQSLGGDAGGGGGAGATGREAEEGGEIRFPWQTGGRAPEDQSPETPLIGKTRIVPIIRQNALAILAPPQYQEHVREMVSYLDRPGRQVMISAIIAEVELNDDFALGLRVSRDDIPLRSLDNSFGGNVSSSNEAENVFTIFDTSILGLNFGANWAIQALAQKTNVRILQEPRVFTADNQEAVFFDGQDIPFVTDSFSNNTGGLTQGFEYRQVGVVLNVRPRITAEKDVDMEIYLELSSIVPGVTLFGGAVVDRRSTTSQIVVKNGQTIVLSGILRDSDNAIERKVPGLGDIPFIGELFKSRETVKETTELVAFITPIVVDNPSENDTNFNAEERERLESLRHYDLQERHDEARESLRDRITVPPTESGKPTASDPDMQVNQREEEDDSDLVPASDSTFISDREP